MMEEIGLYLVLILAIVAGWLLGKFGPGKNKGASELTREIFDEYFVGLNYLLNDEPDEAIDTFIKALEVNSETVETHLALGALLRRRGKVDKAIKVHQALLARPGLNQSFTDSTRIQLAIDYIAAGLLDRAERLLNEILEEDAPAKWDALLHLMTIYQTEKEWSEAIECARQLLTNQAMRRDQSLRTAGANFCCELAELTLQTGNAIDARRQARRAFDFDRWSVRASLLLARIEQRLGNPQAVIKELQRVRQLSPEFTDELLPALSQSYAEIDKLDDYEAMLRHGLSERPTAGTVLAMARLIRDRDGDEAAIEFVSGLMQAHPSLPGLAELLGMQIPRASDDVAISMQLLKAAIERLMLKQPAYRCNHCGFEAKSLYWLCPSCQKWDQIRPLEMAKEIN
ncbi:MAG: lipopolysaccharide assembly protein LapB [Gammaproteobacteria bacterium]